MQKDRINILYLEDDDKSWESFQERVANYDDLFFDRVATTTECIDQFNNTKWDGFIFDAKGITKKGDKPGLAVLGGVIGEFNKLEKKEPHVIYTAHMDGQITEIEKVNPHLDSNLIFTKTETEEMIQYLIKNIKDGIEFKFRTWNLEMFQVLNSKEFFNLKSSYIKLYEKIGKPTPDGWDLKNEMNTIRRILERMIKQIGKIYGENQENDVELMTDLGKKLFWIGGRRVKENKYKPEDRLIPIPEVIYATFNTIHKMSGANIHDYPGTTKKTLDGLLYLMGDLLEWYYNDVMKNPELYDNEVN